MTLQIGLTGQRYAETVGITRFYDELFSRIATLPGVVGVSASTQIPLSGSRDRSGITIEGRRYDNPAAAPSADRYAVRPDYFAVMEIPLLRGRLFTPSDGAGAPPVAIVGRAMAEELWPGVDPIGQRIRVAGGDNNPFREVVGVVRDVKHYGLHLPETLQVYVPHAQTHYPEPSVVMLVRTNGTVNPASVVTATREHVRDIDPLQPVTNARSYDDIVAESMATRRFTLLLLALFAVTALVLAVVGLYGALSYVVTQREREIGVRVALGAGASEIARLVLKQGMTPAALGVAFGLAASVVSGRVVESMLFGVSPRDLATFAAVGALMGVCALSACVVPARKAAAVDPAVTLKAD
jgi:putative ABC transport system permease protein